MQASVKARTMQIRITLCFAELKNAIACSEELLQIVCADDQVIAVHDAVFDGNDSDGCGLMLPINISSLIDLNVDREVRRFSVQSAVNKRYLQRTFLIYSCHSCFLPASSLFHHLPALSVRAKEARKHSCARTKKKTCHYKEPTYVSQYINS